MCHKTKPNLLIQVKNTVIVTQNQIFLDLIFPMQVLLGNEKGFGKQAKKNLYANLRIIIEVVYVCVS